MGGWEDNLLGGECPIVPRYTRPSTLKDRSRVLPQLSGHQGTTRVGRRDRERDIHVLAAGIRPPLSRVCKADGANINS